MLTKIKSNQITFTDARFYTDDDGKPYPSATTILEAYPKPFALLQWMKEVGKNSDEIRDAAGRRGSTVHDLTERYDKGEKIDLLSESTGQPLYSMEEWSMFEKYVEFSTRFSPKHDLIEQQVICPELGFAGTLDRICVIEGKKYLLDIKTSNGIYNSYWLQLAAYRQAAFVNLGFEVDGVAILWLNAKTRTSGKKGDTQGVGWQMVPRDNTDKDWELFQAVQKLWLAEHENDTPKEFSYTLSHQKQLI
jgi:hypothetical protein